MDNYTQLLGLVEDTIVEMDFLATIIDTYDDERIQKYADDANTQMVRLLSLTETLETNNEISDQMVYLIKSANFALDAANDEGGTGEMLAVAISALKIVKGQLA